MAEKIRSYDSAAIRITYDLVRCIHAAECVKGLPRVFDPDRRPWIDPDQASADEIATVVSRCPTGALQFTRLDGGAAEGVPPENAVRVVPDGPLYLGGYILLHTTTGPEREERRLALCRCGLSDHKPICDGRHVARGFQDPGDVRARSDAGLAPEGAVEILPQPDGPVIVRGRFRLVDGQGRDLGVREKAVFCRCGRSSNKPFCDGSHVSASFTTD
jgi:CDGSH-type Zn-finger protein/uncharacterized Fe-S cluster protein YjdI